MKESIYPYYRIVCRDRIRKDSFITDLYEITFDASSDNKKEIMEAFECEIFINGFVIKSLKIVYVENYKDFEKIFS